MYQGHYLQHRVEVAGFFLRSGGCDCRRSAGYDLPRRDGLGVDPGAADLRTINQDESVRATSGPAEVGPTTVAREVSVRIVVGC